MPMLDIQRRHAELFRIRLGERTERGRPVALDGRIRLTSPSPDVIEAVIEAYGGVTSAWQDQYQAYIDRTELPVVVLPGQSCAQWWEQWKAKPGGMSVCTHRCDGAMNYQTGEPCSCPPVDQRKGDGVCKPTTRLWIMLPEVAVMGAGRLETHGLIAAETLPQSIFVLQRALEGGDLVPAVLRIRRVESSGKSYVVPQVEVTGLSLAMLGAAASRSPSLPAGGEGSSVARSPHVELPSPPPSLPAQQPAPRALTPEPASPGRADQGRAAAPATTKQLNMLRKMMAERGITDEKAILAEVWELVGFEFPSLKDIPSADVEALLDCRTV